MKDKNMNEKLQNQLSSLLEWAERATTTGVEFVAEQTPLYIQELLIYNFWISLFSFMLGVIFIIIGINRAYSVVWGKLSKEPWEKSAGAYYSTITPYGIQAIVSIILAIVGLIAGSIISAHNLEFVKVVTAPRVFVVDYLRTELNK